MPFAREPEDARTPGVARRKRCAYAQLPNLILRYCRPSKEGRWTTRIVTSNRVGEKREDKATKDDRVVPPAAGLVELKLKGTD
jgi:hypothetical protein